MILKVRAGQMTAAAAAAALGVSRKTYYEWEERGLSAMLTQLEDRKPGRPRRPRRTKEDKLKQQVTKLRQQVQTLAQTAKLRALLRTMDAAPAKKNAKRSSPCFRLSKTSKSAPAPAPGRSPAPPGSATAGSSAGAPG